MDRRADWFRLPWPPEFFFPGCNCCGVENPIWCGFGGGTAKLFQQSGLFTSTIKTSLNVTTGISASITTIGGIAWDGTANPVWSAQSPNPDRILRTSGVFTTTVKTSLSWTGVNNSVGMAWDAEDAPIGRLSNKLVLLSGHFTTTVKTSQDVSSQVNSLQGISWDGTDTPFSGQRTATTDDWLWLMSGQFSSTIKTSQRVDTISDTTAVGGCADYDPDFLFAAQSTTGPPFLGKLFWMSGKFSSTIKSSHEPSTGSVNLFDLASITKSVG